MSLTWRCLAYLYLPLAFAHVKQESLLTGYLRSSPIAGMAVEDGLLERHLPVQEMGKILESTVMVADYESVIEVSRCL